VVNYFYKLSGIEDAQHRVGHDPDRIEAESMQLSGYVPVEFTPWEAASGGKAVACNGQSSCSASTMFRGEPGKYRISIQYFDQNNGVSQYQLLLNDHEIGSWAADDHLPSDKMNGHTSTRHTFEDVQLQTGDTLKIVGHPGGGEPAGLDYVEIVSTRQSAQK
jgi:alpha-glucuronidase